MRKQPARSEDSRKSVFLAVLPALLVIAGLIHVARPASPQSAQAFQSTPIVSRIAEDSRGPDSVDLAQASPTATPIPPPATSTPESYPPATPVPPTAPFTPEPYPPATPMTPTATSSAVTPPCSGPQVMGTAWEDANGNGSRDEGDPPLSGVFITLRRYDTGRVICRTITGPDGRYHCDNLSAGIYLLQATAPAGHQAITPQRWGIDLVCSTIVVDFGYEPGGLAPGLLRLD